MATYFVCLANSMKEGGKCMAGIELNEELLPVMKNGIPKWLRPVCNTPHGEIPDWLAAPFVLLDILSVDILALKPQGYQTENFAFDERSMRKVSSFPFPNLDALCSSCDMIFGNTGKAISEEFISQLDHSLMLVKACEFHPYLQPNPNRKNKPQIRMRFMYQGNEYDFPITDPVFRYEFCENQLLLKDIKEIYLCLSISIAWEGWHFKLIAGIFYEKNNAV